MASGLLLDTDSEDELPAGWEERLTDDGKVFYAKYVMLRELLRNASFWSNTMYRIYALKFEL
jgi:hypothetical protein